MATRIEAIQSIQAIITTLLPAKTLATTGVFAKVYTIQDLIDFVHFLQSTRSCNGTFMGIDEKAHKYDPGLAMLAGFR